MKPANIQPSIPGRRLWGALMRISVALALALAVNGCVYCLPVPVGYHTAGSRRNLTREKASQFQPGKTTLQDVSLALGEPDRIEKDPLRLVYQSERVNFHFIRGWAVPLAEMSGGELWDNIYGKRFSVVFMFSEQGTLQAIDLSDVKTVDFYYENVRY